jgi:hypothetical protein
MHPAAQQAPLPMTLLIYAVVIALFVWRMARPQRTTVFGLWFRPILLVVLTGFVVWSANFAMIATGQIPPPAWEIAIVLLAGAALGVPLGVLRGRHSEVKPTERPGVMYVHSSPVIVIVWIAALLARALLRYLLPGAQSGASIWGDGLLAFAVAALITSAFMIYTKYRQLTAQAQTA